MTIKCTNIQYDAYATLEVATFTTSKQALVGPNLLPTLTPPQLTHTNLLNFHFPISKFLRTGGNAQKQIVKKKKKAENLASHEKFCFRLGKLEIFFFTTRQARKENAYVTFFKFVIVGAVL